MARVLLSNTDLARAFSAWDLLFALVLALGVVAAAAGVVLVAAVVLAVGEVAYAGGRTSPSLLSFWLKVWFVPFIPVDLVARA